MSQRTTPPFRADHVGSFLRPRYLLDARDKFAREEISPAELRKVEDRAITEVVKMQEDAGLQSITDGEFRRTYFHIDFLEQLGGVKTDIPVTIRKPDGSEELAPPVMRVIDKVRHVKDIQLADFQYLKSQTDAHAEGVDSVADDAALPRRARRHQPRALPRPRGVLPGRRRCVRRRAALARRGGLHLRADGRHQPRVPVRPEHARGRQGSAATTRTSCRIATRVSSTAWSRRSPRA